MDDLPLDVRKIIALICDDATKRQLRLANTRWFQIINYRNFPLYLTKKAGWKQIVDRLAEYTKPISLTLREAVIELEDVLEHLTLLTNLSSLDLTSCKPAFNLDWLGMTALTNLTAIKGLSNVMPCSIWKHMTQLEEFDASDYPPITKEDLDLVKTLTNLRKLIIWSEDEHLSLDCITEVYTKLTCLEISFNGVAQWTEKDLQRLSKLKHFMLNHDWEDTQVPKKAISLKYMTDLEILCTSCPIESINSTKLRVLKNHDFTEAEKQMFPKMTGLTRIGSLWLEHDTEYLTALTNLKVLSIRDQKNPDTDDRKYSILGNLATTQLVTLKIDKALKTIDFGYLTRLGSIHTLSLKDTQISGDCLTVLSNLTSLIMNDLVTEDTSVPNSLNKLTKLKNLIYRPDSPLTFGLDLSPLTNLESLSFRTDGEHEIKFGDFSNLTYLSLETFFHEQNDHSFPFFAKLTNLQILKCSLASDVFQYVSAMTNLKNLAVRSLRNADDILLLTSLQHLIKLRCDYDAEYKMNKGIYLTRLTALQELLWPRMPVDVANQIRAFPNMRFFHCSNEINC